MGRLHGDLHRLERFHRARPKLRSDVVGNLVEVAGGVEERAVLEPLEVEVLRLRPEIERVPLLLDPLQRALQHMARVARIRASVGIQDVADQAADVLAVDLPGKHLEGARVGHGHEIALVDPREAFDGRAVDPDALVERLLEHAQGDSDALHLSQDVEEPEVNHLHPALLAELHDLLRRLQTLHPRFPSFVPRGRRGRASPLLLLSLLRSPLFHRRSNIAMSRSDRNPKRS